MSTPYLASRIRELVDHLRADPDPDVVALDELLRVAAQVARLEVAIDELVGAARAELALAPFRLAVAKVQMGLVR